jgi:alpha,alpha-trehalose phosphorylase
MLSVKQTNTKLKTACGASYLLTAPYKKLDHVTKDAVTSEFIFEFSEKAAFEKKSIFVDTLRYGSDLLATMTSLQDKLATKEFAQFVLEQESYLNNFWSLADIQIKGDQAIQEGIRFNLFHLLQSTGRDRFSNIAAKGLSGEGYEGHYFWDTEIYIFPVFLMTQPEIAKRLLLYRYSILEQARNHAKEMGHHKGALFPLRTISGTECSSYFPSGSAQYHISADIAYSFIEYYLVTEDLSFMKDYGAEMLFETARLWAETGHFDGDSFKIDAVTGPDEYTCIVNNNYYTNAMAKYNLRWAVKFYNLLESVDHKHLTMLRKKLRLQKKRLQRGKKLLSRCICPMIKTMESIRRMILFYKRLSGTLKAHLKITFRSYYTIIH